MTIQELWEKIERGETVFWANEGYKVYTEEAFCEHQKQHFSHKNGKVLSVRFIENYFGGLIHESELTELFTKD